MANITFKEILNGKFLVKEGTTRNWRFIFFISILLMFMVASSRKADAKLYRIKKIKKDLRYLETEYAELQKEVMKLQIESYIAEKVSNKGLKSLKVPPLKIEKK